MEPTADTPPRSRTSSTPVGPALITAEAAIPSSLRDGDDVVCQRLDSPAGPLVRIAYRRGDRVLRGPVAVTLPDLSALVEAARAAGITSPA